MGIEKHETFHEGGILLTWESTDLTTTEETAHAYWFFLERRFRSRHVFIGPEKGLPDWLTGFSSNMYNTAISSCIFSSAEGDHFMMLEALSPRPLSLDDAIAGASALYPSHTEKVL